MSQTTRSTKESRAYITPNESIGIHLMRHDLRFDDNEALFKLAQHVEQIVIVYVFDSSSLNQNKYGYCRLGPHRQAFLNQSLDAIKNRAERFNIRFLCLQGDQNAELQKVLDQVKASHLSYEYHAGPYERQQIQRLEKLYPHLTIIKAYSNFLFEPKNLPFDIAEIPNVFSPFRRKVEKNLVTNTPVGKWKRNYKKINETNFLEVNYYLPKTINTENGYKGSEQAAAQRIEHYFFETDGISSYKETRNGLDGWEFSSRLSAFLALGCISPRKVNALIKKYEEQKVANDSTYWLFFELLWREFFQWQLEKQGNLFFAYGGIQKQIPYNQHDQEKFESWVNGTTGYPIVDACMKQIAATGFMSNRGRQLVASCFVHELGLDWRYGAAYFEHILIDFDVASNYGNWQYLAGVGSDPRGHRQFNIETQTQTYDPSGRFINKWLK